MENQQQPPFTEQHWQLAYDLGYGRGLQRGWTEAREMATKGLLGPVSDDDPEQPDGWN